MSSPVRRALISVFDKAGIVDFSRELIAHGVEILSTGGTASLLRAHRIDVTEVSEYTGFPEIMGGRVKTLHPKIHGGILGRRDDDRRAMEENDIAPIDLVVVNLYPFRHTVAKPDCTLQEAIENIDIGGPAMLRAAAKNYRDVAVVVDPDDYDRVLGDLREAQGKVSDGMRFDLALKAFEHTASYDGAIAHYLAVAAGEEGSPFPQTLNLRFKKKQAMRYGENPHQNAAFYTTFYTTESHSQAGISGAKQIQGKALSYNNVADTDAALECVKQFEDMAACVIVKHANPCGVAVAASQLDAYEAAYQTDPESAFGGIIAFNSGLEAETATAITDRQFVEVIIAPEVSSDARAVLKKKENIRLLIGGYRPYPASPSLLDYDRFDYKKVNGGLLVQDRDMSLSSQWEVVTRRPPTEEESVDLEFAWKVAKYVKSNAIVYASRGRTIGVGAGQMSRVNSARIAAIKAQHAGLRVRGAVMASDAFFPFRDGLDSAAGKGITAVIQPGGSMKDEQVIAAADEHDMAMILTGMRHFRH